MNYTNDMKFHMKLSTGMNFGIKFHNFTENFTSLHTPKEGKGSVNHFAPFFVPDILPNFFFAKSRFLQPKQHENFHKMHFVVRELLVEKDLLLGILQKIFHDQTKVHLG